MQPHARQKSKATPKPKSKANQSQNNNHHGISNLSSQPFRISSTKIAPWSACSGLNPLPSLGISDMKMNHKHGAYDGAF